MGVWWWYDGQLGWVQIMKSSTNVTAVLYSKWSYLGYPYFQIGSSTATKDMEMDQRYIKVLSGTSTKDQMDGYTQDCLATLHGLPKLIFISLQPRWWYSTMTDLQWNLINHTTTRGIILPPAKIRFHENPLGELAKCVILCMQISIVSCASGVCVCLPRNRQYCHESRNHHTWYTSVKNGFEIQSFTCWHWKVRQAWNMTIIAICSASVGFWLFCWVKIAFTHCYVVGL